ncbi:MAG TPA: hypothetical protein VFQ61_37840, partial [Polyangiaceae bacterium]|nr:hypothetical protein [Polyangiaceae bacterium]
EDRGPPVPLELWESVVRHDTDPASVGRPLGITLPGAHAALRAIGTELRLREGTLGATELWFTLHGASAS